MKIMKIKLSEFVPADYNPRLDLKPGDVEYEKLKRSMEEFGFIEPLVVNERTKHIISGHLRVKVLEAQGITEAEAVIVDFSLEKEKAANIALNRIGEGNWDKDKLAILLDELSRMPDFDIGLVGFNTPEISRILDGLIESKDPDDFDFDGALKSIIEPTTQPGDIVNVGVHRIKCGDSASEADMKSLMGDEKIDLIHMDPPYGCLYLAQNRPDLEARPKKSKRWEKLYKDDLSEEDYEVWLESVLKNIRPYLKDGASAYVWNGHAKFYFMHQVLRKLGFHISTVITWAKPTFAISYGDFNQQTEFCLYSWLKNAPHKWFGPTNETNLWEISRDKASELIHPTQKSVQIPSRVIKNSSLRGDVIFDGFLGSGSSLIAAESLGRRCLGLEIEPKYVDAIVLRYINFVGKNKASKDLVKKYMKEDSYAK